MDLITVKDRQFSLYLSEKQILERVDAVADRINRELDGKNPLFLCVLNGSFMFASDLMKRVNIPAEIQFVKVSSYDGTDTTGKLKRLIGINSDIKGRTVVILEDIVDTGLTMRMLIDDLQSKEPAEIKVCTLLVKPGKLKIELPLSYVAMEIPNDFIVGYGLDYDGYGRNYPNIYSIVD